MNFEIGRQFIRWGKTDLLNPTDRFAPKDFLNVVNTEFLGVLAARLTYEKGRNTWDAVYVPYFTPSRGPLLNQRWLSCRRSYGGCRCATAISTGQAADRWVCAGPM